ncbi:unnamed protein product [Linum tenue]|uniref:Complex III subunit 9 n=1 Tax=Linum tenue TaxID=586396 RepID=A0AAV0NVL6_9ROSI|nr:unnamed protein product [Linum tenue]
MERVPRRGQSGLFEGIYKVFMRRTSVYATFVLAGAFFGERVLFYYVSLMSMIY